MHFLPLLNPPLKSLYTYMHIYMMHICECVKLWESQTKQADDEND